MKKITRRSAWGLAVAVLLACATVAAIGESPAIGSDTAPSGTVSRSIEDLNYKGGDAAMPLFTDSVIDVNSAFRRNLLRHGLAFRLITGPQYVQNVLAAPVAADQQVYVGQRPYENPFAQPILAWDLRQLHLNHAQLYLGADWNWVSWKPAGPKTLQLWALYFYKMFGHDRVELKTGYIANNMNFVGLFVGGSTATGAQGVYAVLPYEVGMSYYPLTAPSTNVRVNGPGKTYLKVAAQRSIDPGGGVTEVERNHTGFRFLPHGDKLVLIDEDGYQRASAPETHSAWFRTGVIYNTTKYPNKATGREEGGNRCLYALMDYQWTQVSRERPNRGIYVGGSVMDAPKNFDAYARYYELRSYDEGPWRRRPDDVISLVASHTGYSSVFTNALVAQGSSVWRSGSTLTGSYSLRAAPGNYLSLGFSYLYGPAITPRVANGLTATANWSLFF